MYHFNHYLVSFLYLHYSSSSSSELTQSRIGKMLFPRALLLLLASICLATPAASEPTLPPEEVNALKEIAATLGKSDWDFSVDPCSGLNNWSVPNTTKENTNAVTCNCSFAVCHVISIELKSQNLSGTLPPELTKLPFLQGLDLTRNYLNGTIPVEWGSMKLVNISLGGNRISGPLPKELGNISTLAILTLEYNQLNGTIPPELGNLSSIERLCLSSNNFTGTLPVELAKLATLQDFRISDSHFEGSIPNYIQSWPHLQRLAIQASGLSGPIPSDIFSWTNISDLRISDLNGNVGSSPPISKATNMKTLILRNCNISGQLPDNLGSLKNLKVLDLSFNNFTGPIPRNFGDLSGTKYIYLTRNFISGFVPEWMLNTGNLIDLSYNNFTENPDRNCQYRKTNLFASSSRGNTSGIVSCLRSFPCPRIGSYSLHINCGGKEVKLNNGTIYEGDTQSDGPSSTFFTRGSYWGFSSTGHFMDNNLNEDTYIWDINNSSISRNNLDSLYKNARLSPLSLTYYGFCLQNGSYTVNLHFAEIMFTDDRTYASLGKRFFDIFIQGKLVKKDFNIEDEAGGVNKPIVRSFPAMISDGTLEIRFYWAGKGTDAIPSKGVYGPLISAISVESDFPHGNSLSAGAIAGIVIAVLFIISAVLVILWWKGCLRSKDSMKYDLRGLDLQTGSFTLRQIIAATNNFDAANKIGEGGFGSVFRGHLADGAIIAVKQLSSKSKQGNREFVNEIGMISAIQHPNLVKLYGCCVERDQLLLVYEYMENNSLARALFGPEELKLELNWPTRHNISIGIARGLAYLHEESRLKIVHRDIKSTNVLLDQNLNPKISDFGLAKLDEEENTHISTRIAGTFGYMAPEYAMRGYLTDKADVYSFGVVLLEIVSGRSNTSINQKQDCFYLLDWANQLKEEGKLMEIIDPRLGSDINEEEVIRSLHIALLCTNVAPTERPNMSSVVSMLEGRRVDGGFVSDSTRKNTIKAPEIPSENENQEQHVPMDVPFTASTSAADLYPVILDSAYLLNRS